MVKFDFINVDMGGMPITSSLGTQITLSKRFYYFSLILQISIFLFFGILFSFAVYRANKKIKNPKFIDKLENINNQQDNTSQKQQEDAEENEGQQKKQTDDNLIYKFDEDEPQKNKKQDSKSDKPEQSIEEDQQTLIIYKRFFQIEEKVLLFSPTLISTIVSINTFTCDYISCICFFMSLILFLVFNIFEIGKKFKALSLIYFLPILTSFIPLYLNQADFTI